MSSYFWMILRGQGEKSCFRVAEGLGNEAGGFGDLDGLGAAPGAEFVEEAAGMGFDGVCADEKAFGDFAVAEAGGDEA